MMLHKLKKKIKSIFLSKTQDTSIEKPIVFPGGITPIEETKDKDVFIVGFPKSGNTLMQHIIAHLYYGINDRASRSMINLMTSDIYASTHYFRFNDICFFKSHELPTKRYRRVIYIMRDGREALLSYYYMMKNMGSEVTLEDLYTGKEKIYGVLWHEHIAQWEANPYNAKILFLKFEDLKNDKLSALRKICNFLSISRTEEELAQVVKNTSLKHMKELELRADWGKMKANRFKKDKSFVRKGAVNSYKQEVPKEQLDVFENQNKSILNKYY